jgi:hypothetical protein
MTLTTTVILVFGNFDWTLRLILALALTMTGNARERGEKKKNIGPGENRTRVT